MKVRIGDYELHVWDEYGRLTRWKFGERPKEVLKRLLKELLAEKIYSPWDEKVKIAWNVYGWDGVVEHGEGTWDVRQKSLEITCLEAYK